VRAEYTIARAVCEETMALAEQLGDGMATGTCHVDLASVLIHLGELERAHDHAERARALVDGSSIQGVAARVLLAGACAHLGLVARSNTMRDEALACAAQAGLPYFSAIAATHAAWSTLHLRDVERTRRLAEETLRLASECGFSIPWIYAAMFLGWCDVEEGRAEVGRVALHGAFLEFTASGERASTTNWQAVLARAHLACGDVARANQVLDAAFAFAQETGERIAEHELHRLRGECLLVSATTPGHKERAAEHFERAIAIAAERKALLFELRAATSLLRLRGNAVRERVTRLVARFDAANDCADARLARALLGV
jgi:tetratricopeptide (TPR) repeat protein